MRKTYSLLLFFFLQNIVTVYPFEGKDKTTAMIRQEIRYSCEGANEVYLVWGINNWAFQDLALRPPGTYVKGNLMYTPMQKNEEQFSLKLNVKQQTMIDYVFWITKGNRDLPSDTWDLNKLPQKDYHTLALNDNITFITSNIKVKTAEPLSVLHFSTELLMGVLTFTLLFFGVKRYRHKTISLDPGPRKIIITNACILLFFLFLIRASILSLSSDLYLHPLNFMPQFLWGGFYDLLYVNFLTLAFLVLLFVFKKFPRIQLACAALFTLIGFLSLLSALFNIRFVAMFGKPFNYQWLYYADLLNSLDARAALSATISPDYIMNILLICFSAVIAGIAIAYFVDLLIKRYRARNILLGTLLFLNVGYLLSARTAMAQYNWSYDKLSNPIAAFIESMDPFSENPELFSMKIPDSLRFVDPLSTKHIQDASFAFPDKIKNVLIYVLESTPAEYIQPYDQKFKVTPQLEKYLSDAVLFENVYAHAPATNKSMVSLLGSIYPWLSYASITQEHPEISIPTLSAELKQRGYRTAFLNSGDNRFQRGNEFLAKRKFDILTGCSALECKSKFQPNNNEWDPLNGVDDECTGERLIQWIKCDPGKPFFGMMWTFQTHYPYYATGLEKQYATSDPILNRYLNAVNHSDLVLGKILEELKQAGLYESTLVVVIGDHGEAFGRHGQTTHASGIYEENLHIPCVFINPVFKGEKRDGAGGMIDVAPTIMNILGLPQPKQWQGKSLFLAKKNDPIYFFSPWSDHLFGYRQGDQKYIFNASKNTTEVYDLKKDPQESNNIAALLQGKTGHYKEKLAAWVQYQKNFMDVVLVKK